MNQSKFVNGPQGRLHIDDGGSGAAVPVLFVHGNGANLTQWRAQLDHLRRTRRAVAFDLRGMGRSDPAANGDYSPAAMVDDIEAVAQVLGLRRFVIVGHSFGGTVVAAYAAQHPERVAGLVLADASGNVKVDKATADKFLSALRANKDSVVRQWFAPILKPSSEAVRDAVYTSVHNTPVEVLIGALQSLTTIDVGPLLRAYHGPKLAIVAADIENPMSLHVQFPQVPVKKMTGVGHWLMMDKPDEFNRLLDEFLATVR
jgi:pimeloyl-ACP methyl ester carboxylesterase